THAGIAQNLVALLDVEDVFAVVARHDQLHRVARLEFGNEIRLNLGGVEHAGLKAGKPDGMVGSKRPLVDGIKFMVIP
ncbi:hypothetical protein ACC736_39840, partial [Rhizobium ruizarguesonis]